MISWIQITFQRHFRVVFLVLLAVVIVAFVFTIGNMPGLGGDDRSAPDIEMFGVSFSSSSSRQNVFADAQLSYMIESPNPYYDSSQLERHAYQRMAALQYAEKLHIPQPTDSDLEEFIRVLPTFTGPEGNFDPQIYAQFVDSVEASPIENRTRFARVLREDWRISEVAKIVGGPGYVLDDIVKRAVATSQTEWSVASSTLDLSEVQPDGEPEEAELNAWFEANSFRYQIPPRTRVSYVLFRAADMVASVQPSDEEIARYFEENNYQYQENPTPVTEGEAPPPAPDPQLDDVRDQVIADLKESRASFLAAKAAADFAYALFDLNIARDTEAFDEHLAQRGLTLRTSEPFTATQPPPSSGWGPQVLAEGFRLDATKLVSDPVAVGDDSIILFFEERIPPTTPLFFSVRELVLADVQADRRQKAIAAKGEEVRAQLTGAIAGGQSFAEASTAAGLESRSWESFTLRNPPEDLDYGVRTRMVEAKTHTVSPMSVQGDQGSFTYVLAKNEPEIADDAEELNDAREQLKAQSAATTVGSIFDEIVRNELVTAGLADPVETP